MTDATGKELQIGQTVAFNSGGNLVWATVEDVTSDTARLRYLRKTYSFPLEWPHGTGKVIEAWEEHVGKTHRSNSILIAEKPS